MNPILRRVILRAPGIAAWVMLAICAGVFLFVAKKPVLLETAVPLVVSLLLIEVVPAGWIRALRERRR